MIEEIKTTAKRNLKEKRKTENVQKTSPRKIDRKTPIPLYMKKQKMKFKVPISKYLF